jgi:hypothetical protein
MAYTAYNGPDIVSKTMLDKLNETVNNYNNLSAKVAAADGDKDTALKAWMESADNAQAQRYRDQIAAATTKLRNLAEQNVETVELSEDDRTNLEKELDELKGKIKSGFSVMDNLIQNMSEDPDGVKAALETIGNPTKSNRGRKPGSSGSSLPRVSAVITVNGGELENAVYDSFSKVANIFNCEVKDLQLAFAAAAGVKHEDIKTVDKPVEFQFQPNENGSVYTLKTQPKDRKKPGPRSSASEPEKTEEESDTEAA